MDGKVTEFTQLTNILPTDILYLIRSSTDNFVTLNTLASNLPNIGNSGTTRNAVGIATGAVLPVTGSLVYLPILVSSYSVPSGLAGQELTLVSAGANTVVFSGTTATMVAKSTVTLVYIPSISSWVVKSFYNTTFA